MAAVRIRAAFESSNARKKFPEAKSKCKPFAVLPAGMHDQSN